MILGLLIGGGALNQLSQFALCQWPLGASLTSIESVHGNYETYLLYPM